MAEQAARTTSRRDLQRAHPHLEQVSPDVGVLDEEAFAGLEPDEAASLLVELARATDPKLRAAARAAVVRILVPVPRHGAGERRGGAARIRRDRRQGMDVDLDATIGRLVATPGGADLRFEEWGRPAAAYVLAVDASGSVTGRPLVTAVTTAAAVVSRLRPDDELAVLAFWSRAVVLRHMGAATAPSSVFDRLFDLRGGDVTNLAAGLRAALGQAALARAARREVIVLTDGLANHGGDPLPVAASSTAAGARLHVLCLSDDDDARTATVRLAGAGGGRCAPLLRPSAAAAAVATVLGG